MSAVGSGKAKPFSMVRQSGLHIRTQQRVHMALQAYYDGSGKCDLPAMTLSGIAADESLWGEFECLWEKALDRNEVPDRLFSMTDLMSEKKRFKEGWTVSRRHKLLTDLFNVLGKFRHRGLAAYSCTIVFDAYDKTKEEVPTLRVPEAICVNYCVGGLSLTAEQLADQHPILLYFDRKETFLRTIYPVWCKGRKKKVGWPMQVGNIIPVDSSHYPIQAADLIAWIVNRVRRRAVARGEPQPQPKLSFDEVLDEYSALFVKTWLVIHHNMMWYDNHRQIIERYPKG